MVCKDLPRYCKHKQKEAGMFLFGGGRQRTRKVASIALIRVFGELSSDQPNIRDIMDVLLDHDCSSYCGVVMLIDCPGGTLAGAQGLESLVKMRFRDAGMPVYAVVLERCLSAGMHLACFADRVYATPGALFGSFGASMEWPESHLLREKIGLSRELYKTRPHKDLCSPYRKPTYQDKCRVMELLDSLDSQFLKFICERRNLQSEDLKLLLDGRLITGADAMCIGLVDEFGGVESACEKLVPGFPSIASEITFLGGVEPSASSPTLLQEIMRFLS